MMLLKLSARSCTLSKSRSAFCANSSEIASPDSSARSHKVFSAPSRSRTLEGMRRAIRYATSSGSATPLTSALESRIAARVSKSGGSIATDKPQPRRDESRGSRLATSLG